ncbi:hypothetical protein B0J13DRAFT_631887 [Dactylonectria estremocensis]|uniref:VWFA domain-containing protein n=1 Tax=Dactylonectria estremocensis TaxID=1079267 RepID=A0A9P9D1V4_9HYPO|nr:hypothetical protein B0J13DRAFT_631887 [Dactylonectria estremocensis]
MSASEPHSAMDNDDLENTLRQLRCFDTMFLVDDSEHMQPYWPDVKTLIERVAPICAKHDPDGIDLYFVNHRPGGVLAKLPGVQSIRKSGYTHIGGFVGSMLLTSKGKQVGAIFDSIKPAGKCNMGARLGALLKWYCDKYTAGDEKAALNIVVLTAGQFDDDIKAPLIQAAKVLDDAKAPTHQAGVQLFRLGGPNVVRQKTLQHLDDELHKEAGTRDIVDTVTWSGHGESMSDDELLKVVLGAVIKKIDVRASELHLDNAAPGTRAERSYFEEE